MRKDREYFKVVWKVEGIKPEGCTRRHNPKPYTPKPKPQNETILNQQ